MQFLGETILNTAVNGLDRRGDMRRIPLGYLKISEQGKRYVLDALDNNRLSAGKYMRRFERAFANEHQAKHAIFCNSGTSALQIALAALREHHGYQDDDEVLVPALTFIATSNIVLQNRLKPVFVDIDPLTFNLNPTEISEKITPRTRAIIPVHLLGLPCDMDLILDLARKYHLQVLEDSAETMFARYKGRMVGSFGDLGCFSTYVAHILVGGVGGLVTTCQDELAVMSRSLLGHGRDHIYLNIDDDDSVEDEAFRQIVQRRFSFVRIGYSYRATELEAAVALSEFELWQENIRRRRQNGARLIELLKPLEEHIQLPHIPQGSEHSFMMFAVVARDHVDRDAMALFLERRGIETRYLFPLLSQPVYRRLFLDLEERYPVAKRVSQQGIYFGCHQGLNEEDLQYIAETFLDFLSGETSKRAYVDIQRTPSNMKPS